MGCIIVSIFGIFAFTNLSNWTLENLMGIEGEVLDLSTKMLKILVLFPLFVTIRDFYQGIAIKLKMTPIVTIGTFVRVGFVGLAVLFVDKFTFMPGWVFAPGLFAVALLVEATTVVITVKTVSKNITRDINKNTLNNGETINTGINNEIILRFFLPLVLAALLRTMSRPIINAGLANTIDPVIAISSFSIAWSLGVLAISPLMMFHQVPINFLKVDDTEENKNQVKLFAAIISAFLSFVLIIFGFTPVGIFILENFMNAQEIIVRNSISVLRIMSVLPILFVIRQYYWGILMKRRTTKLVSLGKVINLISVFFTVLILVLISNSTNYLNNPATIGAFSMVIGEIFECSFLHIFVKKLNALKI